MYRSSSQTLFLLSIATSGVVHVCATVIIVSEPNPLRPLRDLQYGLGETVFGGCRHLEYMHIWGFNEPKYYFVCLRQEAQMGFFNVFC